jgi:hypothetical protein
MEQDYFELMFISRAVQMQKADRVFCLLFFFAKYQLCRG